MPPNAAEVEAFPRPESPLTADETTHRVWNGRRALVLAVLVITLVRLWYCAQVPVNTADLLRSMYQALFMLRDGLGVAGVPLAELDEGLARVGWARLPYSYPPLVLPSFGLVAAISPTLFAAKLALTVVEAVNAMLLTRITSSRWLGVLYWASPASLWWVSGEGQFEPLMAVFMFSAMALIRKQPALALALLACGVNVKVTAVLLLPWCLLVVERDRPDELLRACASFVVALAVPLLVAGLYYPVIDGLLGISGSLRYNPYYWDVTDRRFFGWNPTWLVAINAIATSGVIAVMAFRATRVKRGWHQFGGAIAFVILVKVSTLAQFWYFLLFPAFVMPIEDHVGRWDVRWWLVALTPLLDVRSLVEVFGGPFGWLEARTYEGLSSFTGLGVES